MSEAFFGQYGKQFQETIFQALLSDRSWAMQMIEVMTPEYFDLKYLQYLCKSYFEYHHRYKDFPTLSLIVTIIRDDLREGKDTILRDQIIDYLQRMRTSPNMGDLQYVKDKSLDFCRKQAMKEALEKAVEMIATDNLDSVVGLMKDALAAGTPASVGHNFFEDTEARFIRTQRLVCPTGLPQIDAPDILNGGLGRGELGVIIAPTGVGKCSVKETDIYIRYTGIKINGRRYKPWDWVETKRGRIRARDVIATDELI
jgi:hypothetical protein